MGVGVPGDHDNFDAVNKLYENNNPALKRLIQIISLHLDIPCEILEDSVKRVLVEAINPLGKKKYLLYKSRLLDFFILLSSLGYFFFLSLIGSTAKRVCNYDILFEEWSESCHDNMYKGIYRYFPNKIVKILLLGDNVSCTYMKSISTRRSFLFSRKAAWKLFILNVKLLFKIIKLNNKSDLSLVRLSILMYRYILIYETDVLDIKSKILVSAADNNYNSLRYFIYKKNGIENILLIQNGVRYGKYSDQSGDMFTYCDYYFGFGPKQISIQSGMKCENKISIGSVGLYNSLEECLNEDIEYDIVFVDGYTNCDNAFFSQESYKKVINNIVKFQNEFKQLKILFRLKPSQKKSNNIYIEKRNFILESAGVIMDRDISKNTYEAIMKSKLVVFYRTTVGLESLALGKRVLECNYDGSSHYYCSKSGVGCLTDHDYVKFRDRVNELLSSNSKHIDLYYEKLKGQYMSLNGNPNKIISNIISNVLKAENSKSGA